MFVGDVQDYESLNSVFVGADVVYNFAALADLNDALREPRKTLNINVVGNLIYWRPEKNEVNRFVYASTVYVHSREGGFIVVVNKLQSFTLRNFKEYMDWIIQFFAMDLFMGQDR